MRQQVSRNDQKDVLQTKAVDISFFPQGTKNIPSNNEKLLIKLEKML